ncbi:hypothetical protein PRIPAC_87258 [Pristionchus pacificus]|uniref:NADAR domain-containing protein n=1 Tax=Pristionchus pacificus TaxID=54126 RepID=A0A2A6CW83_PRIPA|nr:hypothetical protein PRIPAC_87258 [Pristionchus pacificus]|eukprot:PDM82419.1 hypothetical protein PRIPAC_36812 [Pristionchus pacificus]
MSYYGSFSSSAFARDEPFDARRTIAAAEPYGSARYATTDSTWALNQTANIWSTNPLQNRYDQPSYAQPQQYAQPSYGQPRYGQIFEQQSPQPLSGRPLNQMAGSMDAFPRYSYMSGSGGRGSYGGSSYNSGHNDRYDDRRGGGRDYGRDGGRDNNRGDNRNGSGNRNYNNSRGGGGQRGDGRRRNDDNGPRRVNEFASPKQSKQKKDYGPSRIAPADSNTSVRGERREQPRGDGKRPYNKDGDGGRRNDRGGKPMRRRKNQSSDLEFVKIPDDVESKSFDISEDNLVCFSGLQSVLATQHEFPIVIDGSVYASVDHYYQIRKCKQLVGKNCEPLVATVQDEVNYKVQEKTGAGGNSYGQLAREFLKEHKIDREKVEKWRREGGVFATYDAMRAKVQQCSEMRDMLKDAADKIIVHTYAGDAIFGSGTRVQFVRKWAEEMKKSGGKLAGGLPLIVTAASLEMSTNKLDLSSVDISQEDEDELMKDE